LVSVPQSLEDLLEPVRLAFIASSVHNFDECDNRRGFLHVQRLVRWYRAREQGSSSVVPGRGLHRLRRHPHVLLTPNYVYVEEASHHVRCRLLVENPTLVGTPHTDQYVTFSLPWPVRRTTTVPPPTLAADVGAAKARSLPSLYRTLDIPLRTKGIRRTDDRRPRLLPTARGRGRNPSVTTHPHTTTPIPPTSRAQAPRGRTRKG
jgi:hypothetical protein